MKTLVRLISVAALACALTLLVTGSALDLATGQLLTPSFSNTLSGGRLILFGGASILTARLVRRFLN